MSEAVVWGGRLDTATTTTTKYHGINIKEGGKRRTEEMGEGRDKSEMASLGGPVPEG
jgi:hypothetical protein